MIKNSTRPQRRRELLRSRGKNPLRNRLDQKSIGLFAHIGPSRYMPHIGAKQRAKGSA